MNSSIDTLIVTAHPDDETIFFAGPIFSRQRSSTYVVCVTNGNADNEGKNRIVQFQQALSKFGVQGVNLGLPDVYDQRLDIDLILQKLSAWAPGEVFTHNIHGEYGHPHHQDVSYAVHKRFYGKCAVYSTAYNCFPEIEFSLSEKEWNSKFETLSEIYWSETHRFQQFLPCSWKDGYLKMSFDEAEYVYQALVSQKEVEQSQLKALKPYAPYLLEQVRAPNRRPF